MADAVSWTGCRRKTVSLLRLRPLEVDGCPRHLWQQAISWIGNEQQLFSLYDYKSEAAIQSYIINQYLLCINMCVRSSDVSNYMLQG